MAAKDSKVTRVTEGTEDPQREDPKEHQVLLVCQVTPADRLMAQTVVTESGDLAVFPVLPAFLGLQVPPV